MVKSSDPSPLADILKAATVLPAVRQTNALSDAMRTVNALRLPQIGAAGDLSRILEEQSTPLKEITAPDGLIGALQGHLHVSAPSAHHAVFDVDLPETPASRPASRKRVSSTADLGALVRDRRLKMGLIQQDLADAAGTGRRFISELEGGKATLEFGRILQVCRILGIDLFAMTR